MREITQRVHSNLVFLGFIENGYLQQGTVANFMCFSSISGDFFRHLLIYGTSLPLEYKTPDRVVNEAEMKEKHFCGDATNIASGAKFLKCYLQSSIVVNRRSTPLINYSGKSQMFNLDEEKLQQLSRYFGPCVI